MNCLEAMNCLKAYLKALSVHEDYACLQISAGNQHLCARRNALALGPLYGPELQSLQRCLAIRDPEAQKPACRRNLSGVQVSGPCKMALLCCTPELRSFAGCPSMFQAQQPSCRCHLSEVNGVWVM